jgi:hypothetical protein
MSYLNATSAGKGFEQSGGGYFYIIDANLPSKLQVWGATNTSASGALASGSGGAWSVGGFATAQLAQYGGASYGGVSTLFGTGRIVRDMGKTQVSAGRTFRKIKGIVPVGAASTITAFVPNTDGGQYANAINSQDTGYLTFYVETGRDGVNAVNAAGLVRFM